MKERPTSMNHYLEKFSHENDGICTIARDKVEIFNCHSTYQIASHRCLVFEKTQCTSFKSDMCLHFATSMEEKNNCV